MNNELSINPAIRKIGRPQVLNEDNLRKLMRHLEEDCSIEEASKNVGIAFSVVYDKMRKDKSFSQEIERSKNMVATKAKRNLAKSIKRGELDTSKWWLERKRKAEYSLRTEVTGTGGQPVQFNVIHWGKQLPEEKKDVIEGEVVESSGE